ncbi:hypothetical protein LCGC14_2623630 [marine sediment metagenome]|uniref:Phage virion morphogenesis protein n=1 Tax=marine sediment metagenome TaxID=412755 RepID=A0A0F9A2D7_9ZZZZ|tara:strand:+ start:156 stop:707 length:552 start_codon:yes stop_codon:yes gene_type:complete
MTGIILRFSIENDEVSSGLSSLAQRLDDATGFYRSVGENLKNSTRDRFDSEESPEGIPWKKLLPSTIRAREKSGKTPIKILRASDNTGLAYGINYRADNKEVSVGSMKPYAAIHQLGGIIKKPARTALQEKSTKRFVKASKAKDPQSISIPAHTVNIPARPFLGISSPDEERIINITRDWLNG